MALPADTAVHFFDSPATVSDTTDSVAANAFSIEGDAANWTNADSAAVASFVLGCTFSVAPSSNGIVALFARLMNISGTDDAPIPTINNPDKRIGFFLTSPTTSPQFLPSGIVELPNNGPNQVYQFYIQNLAGQTISSGWTLAITPIGIGPKA